MLRFCYLLILLPLLFSCATDPEISRFDFLQEDYSRDLNRLLQESDYSSRFVIMESLVSDIRRNEGMDAMRSFVHQYSLIRPDDPYLSYYYLRLSRTLVDQQAELSIYYLNRLLNNFPDIQVLDASAHFYALRELLELEPDPSRRIEYYQRLIRNFDEYIDIGLTWYRIAQEYRKDSRYSEYFTALEEFQTHPQATVPGLSNIHQKVGEELAFHFNNSKDWTSLSLNTLVTNIKSALYNKNAWSLERYRAKENFFAMSWLQDTGDMNSRSDFDLGRFLLNAGRISYNTNITVLNEHEAYLKTLGWSFRIPNWYFYFKKVNYPADPEIHGNWEWAGIYFGDTLNFVDSY